MIQVTASGTIDQDIELIPSELERTSAAICNINSLDNIITTFNQQNQVQTFMLCCITLSNMPHLFLTRHLVGD